MWIDSAAELLPGDVIAQQFGADFPPIDRIEWLDEDRARLHFTNGATGRVKVSGGRIRLQSRRLVDTP